ncbi:SDR family NAD(P)-dependent oxidoreductase [Mycolicibacterium sp. 22603]|uniref:SDR family NAD(P)-dependent oxidoreductase n=1 Tax=Mycolicibacterium sp. 22603 TaxID=3453950 RepID=UPI003F84A2D6
MTDIVLITGGSRGIGFETASALGLLGATVIITGRTPATLAAATEELARRGVRVEAELLDVVSPESVRHLLERVRSRHDRLDVLVNNAGVAGEWSHPSSTGFVHPDAARITFDTNVLGVLYMIEAFLPLLRASADARIVNVSSFMGSLALQSQAPPESLVVPAYQASKAALNSITITLDKALSASGIRAVSVDPGFVQTDFSPINRDQAPLTAAQGAEPIVRAASGQYTAGTFIGREGPLPW